MYHSLFVQTVTIVPSTLMVTCRALLSHGTPWSFIEKKKKSPKSVQLIYSKTKAFNVLFAGHSGNTIEDGTIGFF